MEYPELQTNLGYILLWPAVGALINGLIGDRLGRLGVSLVGCLASGLAFVVALTAVNEMLSGDARVFAPQLLFEWIALPGEAGEGFNLGINASLAFDTLAATMLMVVTGIGFLIHVYSTGYMKGDPGYHRYFAYLNLFLFAMLVLVLADNLVLMFVGWEGVGLASYLLIGFWFKDLDNANAGKKAFVVNRIGDFAFLLGIFVVAFFAGSVAFADLNAFGSSDAKDFAPAVATIAGILFFVGACGKSAQIPLHVWLPDAMAGPTPVSALIHAATMVTAGVYMVGRLGPFFELAPGALEVVCFVGATTALVAATIGIVQNDIKKVLAYSTVSQLGYMFIGMGLGADGYAYGIFHLVTHAFFKALLFLGAGAVIYAMHHEQDMRKMGGLRKKMPLTFLCFLIGGLALAGVPPFSGFWSKDAILHHTLEKALHPGDGNAWVFYVAFVFGMLGAIITAFYTTRLFLMTFFGVGRSKYVEEAKEVGGGMSFALMVLLLLSAAGGFLLADGWSDWLGHSIPVAHHGAEHAGDHGHGDDHGHGGDGHADDGHGDESVKHLVEALSIAAALLGIIVGWVFYGLKPGLGAAFAAGGPARKGAYRLLSNKYYFDEIYQRYVVDVIDGMSRLLHRLVDVALIDGLYNSLAFGARQFGFLGSAVQTGNLSRYVGLFALGALFVLLTMVLGVS